MTELLDTAEIHVWLAQPDAMDLSSANRLLAAGELKRRDRMRHERTRRAFVAGRVLVRSLLTRYGDRPATDWRFELNQHGRPDLVAEQRHPLDLRFNLSHTNDLLVCAIARGRDVGVDVENVNRRNRTTAIANRFFTTSEVAALRALPEQEQRERFYTYWTLKEAYIKARGMGLAIPLGSFAFMLDGDRFATIDFSEGCVDDPNCWRFFRSRPTADHRLAVAVAAKPGSPIELRCFWTTPSRIP